MGSFNNTVGADASRYDGAPGRIFGLAGTLPYRNAKYKALLGVHENTMHDIHKGEHAAKLAKKAAEKEAAQKEKDAAKAKEQAIADRERKKQEKATEPVASVNAGVREAMGGPAAPSRPTARTPIHPANPVNTTEAHPVASAQQTHRHPIGMPYRKAPLRTGWTTNVNGSFQANPEHQKMKQALISENEGRKAQFEAQGRGSEFVPKRIPGERKDPKNPKLEQPFAEKHTPSRGTGAQIPPKPRKTTSLSTRPL